MWRPGELDQRIDIKRMVKVPDSMGGNDFTLTDVVANLWCKVRPMSGKEVERFQKLNPEFTNLFVVRYRNDLLEDDRVLWNGKEYNIRAISEPSTRSMYLEFYAERGVAQ